MTVGYSVGYSDDSVRKHMIIQGMGTTDLRLDRPGEWHAAANKESLCRFGGRGGGQGVV